LNGMLANCMVFAAPIGEYPVLGAILVSRVWNAMRCVVTARLLVVPGLMQAQIRQLTADSFSGNPGILDASMNGAEHEVE